MSQLPLTDKPFTFELTSGTMTISETDSVKFLSVFNTTATTGTLTGEGTVDGNTAGALTIAQNQSINIGGMDDSILDGITITAPAGCTLQIVAIK